jgi:hypothetical protein
MTTQQQQQHSLLSQASWGRLEMKPKRDNKQETHKGTKMMMFKIYTQDLIYIKELT